MESGDFEQTRRAHAAADAHRDDDVLRAATLTFDQCMADHACAAEKSALPSALKVRVV